MIKKEGTNVDQTITQLQAFFEEMTDIRLFAMNGSKVNQNIIPDKFQDYDVVFFTDDIEKYKKDASFLLRFGEILIMTEPDKAGCLYPLSFPDKDGYIFLVQYTNGVRIDLQFQSLKRLDDYLRGDSLTKIIGDKDQRVKKEIIPTDKDYWLLEPTSLELESSVKEFWWQMNNTLKAILRDEFLLAQFYLTITRSELLRLMTWHVAFNQGFNRSYGKEFHQVLNFLSENDRQEILISYDTSSNDKLIESLKIMQQLAERYTRQLCAKMAVDYQSYAKLAEVPSNYLRSKGEHLATAFE